MRNIQALWVWMTANVENVSNLPGLGTQSTVIEEIQPKPSSTAENVLNAGASQEYAVPDIVLLRLIGNELPPVHIPGHNRKILQYILENEKKYDDVARVWVLNRIVDDKEKARIITLLDLHKQEYIEIPFVLTDYAKQENVYENVGYTAQGKDMLRDKRKFQKLSPRRQEEVLDAVFAKKNIYAINVNGARNVMLTKGKASGARWILPFDGHCVLTDAAINGIRDSILKNGERTKYMYIPSASAQIDNELKQDFELPPDNTLEPQLMFRSDSVEMFNENLRYGRRARVEMFYRLMIKGPWNKWKTLPWEKNVYETTKDNNHVAVPRASFVTQLSSRQRETPPDQGSILLDGGQQKRAAVVRLVEILDTRVAVQLNKLDITKFAFYDEDIMTSEKHRYQKIKNRKKRSPLHTLVLDLLRCANKALIFPPFSVANKTEIPPSGDYQDYYSPAPYFWPNPDLPNGLPYMRVDGQRVPGTGLYDPESNKFDRSRLSSFFGNTTCLALGYFFSGDERYAKKAAGNLRTWFINPKTRMRPNCKYAQIQWGYNDNIGSNYGVIETKDFYFLLDAIRIIERTRFVSADDESALRLWFREYVNYLNTSKQGRLEYFHHNNHGTFFDVQSASIASYIGDIPLFLRHTEIAKTRILSQFTNEGVMPGEMVRPTQLHYMMFGLQGWYTLSRLAEKGGIDLWHYKQPWNSETDRMPIKQCTVYTVPEFNETWSHPQAGTEDMTRMLPLYYCALDRYPELASLKPAHAYTRSKTLYGTKGVLNAHSGVPYYWNLGLSRRGLDEEHTFDLLNPQQ
eukprot:CFRG6112T1